MKTFFEKWLPLLSKGGVAVATVIGGIGSVPRENGAQMLVTASGETVDSVGGGKLEADVIACAKEVVRDGKTALRHFEMTGADFAGSDMICGGSVDVLIYYSDARDIPVLEALLATVADVRLLFPAEPGGGIVLKTERDTQKDIEMTRVDGRLYLTQRITRPGTLHIMGAGHISREIVKIADLLEMECAVYDDRPEFASPERFPNARRVLLDDMSKPPPVAAGPKDMIVIVTRGHMHDRECLAWALGTQASYIGMIGSRKKVAVTLGAMREKGFSEERVKNIHAPIGLPIGAKTPAEIAVSIMAEIIAFKRGVPQDTARASENPPARPRPSG